MSGDRQTSVKAGIFVVSALIVFVVFLIVLMGRQWFRDDKAFYTIFDRSVEGLDKGSSVKYLGVPAGTVEDIRFEPGKFPSIRVSMRLKEYIPIKRSTRAVLAMTALTGIGHIELISGKSDEPEMWEGAHILSEPSFYERISRSLPEFLDKLPQLLDRMEMAFASVEVLFGPETRGQLSATLTRLEETASTAKRAIEDNVGVLRRDLSTTAEVLRGTLESVQDEVKKTMSQFRELAASGEIHEGLTNLRDLSKRLAASAEKIDRSLESLLPSIQQDEKLIAAFLLELKQVTFTANELLEKLRQDPSALIFSTPAKERAIPEPVK